ncbi:MAG: YihY/virulence factor BrkB family protein [Tannerellaceae bacterium]|jgi:membrane protein|nr:YihY/virulence factor BrkB family protein [Tannerellaceae bacterium]
MRKHNRPSLWVRANELARRVIYFVSYDIWRITAGEISGMRRLYINIIKTLILAVRGFMNESLPTKASALTYSTLLAIVPLLAVLIGIAKGFGFQNIVSRELMNYFPGHETEIVQSLGFVDGYLAQTKGGVIIGIGLVLLFYTVINLMSSIEDTFNRIWQISKARSWNRRIVDYMALFLILPILMTVSGGFSIFLSTLMNELLSENPGLTPMMGLALKAVPYFISSCVFATIYLLLPNTRVNFLNGVIPGFIAGISFQFFQIMYINGQIWVSKYNAIYGSFAALPLLLLWLQLSWLICLFGAELSYASQNVKKFGFERDSSRISRRYKDFITLLIASLIIKRFATGEKPYTADELSESYRIPLRITSQILLLLTETNIIVEVNYENDERVRRYQPSIDINLITVSYLMNKIDVYGSESFKIDAAGQFSAHWQAILKTRQHLLLNANTLVKDL